MVQHETGPDSAILIGTPVLAASLNLCARNLGDHPLPPSPLPYHLHDSSRVTRSMSDDSTRASGLREKLKVAMAVAIAARKQVDRSASTDWKEKALRARSSLMKVSRCCWCPLAGVQQKAFTIFQSFI